MACRPNTHRPSFHVNMVGLEKNQRCNSSRFPWDFDAEMMDEDEEAFELWLEQALASGLFCETSKRRKSWSPFKLHQKKGKKQWRRTSCWTLRSNQTDSPKLMHFIAQIKARRFPILSTTFHILCSSKVLQLHKFFAHSAWLPYLTLPRTTTLTFPPLYIHLIKISHLLNAFITHIYSAHFFITLRIRSFTFIAYGSYKM